MSYVVNVFSQSHCFERFLVVYAAGRPPTANQMPKFRSISEIINPLLIEARLFLQKTGIFCKNRDFLQKPGFFQCIFSQDFFQSIFSRFFHGIFFKVFFHGFFSRDFLGINRWLFHEIFRYKSLTFSPDFLRKFLRLFLRDFLRKFLRLFSQDFYGHFLGIINP